MQRTSEVIVLLGAPLILITSTLPGNSFPITPTPKNLAEYASNRTWRDGITRKFSNLNSCQTSPWGLEDSWGGFACSGFVEEDDPRGRRICELSDFESYGAASDNSHFKTSWTTQNGYGVTIKPDGKIRFWIEKDSCRFVQQETVNLEEVIETERLDTPPPNFEDKKQRMDQNQPKDPKTNQNTGSNGGIGFLFGVVGAGVLMAVYKSISKK